MDSGQDAVHDCHGMPDNGVSIRLEKNYVRRENFVFCLFIERQATEGDLEENHHLEELAKNYGYNRQPLKEIESLVEDHSDELVSAWKQHFSS
ncbi:hypothetical protein [Marinobacter sp. LV10MA510-1]|uniref:hypothetical protein n=1 Tax=Marinobacter sp. LV10MA510-1 TaxID=1415567 RepID=UPI000BF8EA6C|nr:hypothetical protein [Marinobacter sp. LV10MA510-1]PFG10778.1 hypothetical protein ATI45_3266 [Marinobacter sp. LV10MA510-1]